MAVFQTGQTPVFLARIVNSEDGSLLAPSSVQSATYSIAQESSAYGRGAAGTPVEYHDNQAVPSTAFLESALNDDSWTIDAIGYNFKFTPDTREHPAFSNPGEYSITFKIVPVAGNPIVWKRFLRFE